MKSTGLCWIRVPAVTAALGLSLLPNAARASTTYELKPGETLAAIARRFHVTVGDIASANHLKNLDSVADNARLFIPDPPRHITAAAVMHHNVTIKGDRISVRIGPGAEHRRLAMFDNGAPLVVTAAEGDWSQVTLADGRSGWVRTDFLDFGRSGRPAVPQPVSHTPRKHRSAPALPVAEAADRRRKVWRTAKAHHATATMRVAAAAPKRHHAAQIAKAERHHAAQIAKAERRHYHVEIAARIEHSRHSRAVRLARVEAESRHHHRRFIAEADRPAPSNDLIRTAYAYRGTPYRYGGAGRGGFDCSGFTSYLYRSKGVSLPHSARAQFQRGTHVDRTTIKPGDLVFFHTVTPGISHVGMYVGEGKFVHASSRRSGGVRVDSLNSSYYSKAFRGARHIAK